MEGLLTFLLFAGLFYFMMRYGCGAHMVHGHGGHSSQTGKCGGNAKGVDPVCGMEVDPNQGYGKMFEGKHYRFCSRNCLDKFDGDPTRYLGSRPRESESKEELP